MDNNCNGQIDEGCSNQGLGVKDVGGCNCDGTGGGLGGLLWILGVSGLLWRRRVGR